MLKRKTTFNSTTEWLLNGNTGLSSKSLLAAGTGIKKTGSFSGYQVPSDPSDLNRCIIFAENFPEIALIALEKYQQKGGKLAKFAESYNSLKDLFIEEVGFNWSEGSSAPKTYAKMTELLGN